MKRWLATAFSAAAGTAAVLTFIWGAWLLIDPAEQRHYEWAIPMLVFATVLAVVAVVTYRGATAGPPDPPREAETAAGASHPEQPD